MIQPTPQPAMPPSDSFLYLWRCVIAIAQADGEVDATEIEYLNARLKRVIELKMFDPAWMKIIRDDLDNPKKIETLLSKVTDPEDRRRLFYFGGLMSQADGKIKPGEEEILQKIGATCDMSRAEIDKYVADAHRALADRSFVDALNASHIGSVSDFKAVLDALLKKVGIKA